MNSASIINKNKFLIKLGFLGSEITCLHGTLKIPKIPQKQDFFFNKKRKKFDIEIYMIKQIYSNFFNEKNLSISIPDYFIHLLRNFYAI